MQFCKLRLFVLFSNTLALGKTWRNWSHLEGWAWDDSKWLFMTNTQHQQKTFQARESPLLSRVRLALWTIWVAKGCSTLIWTFTQLNVSITSRACSRARIVRESCEYRKFFVGQLQIVCAYLSMRLLKVRGKWSWLVYVTYHEEYGRRTIIFPGETSASGSWRDRGQAISSTLHLNTLLITDQKLISGTVQKNNFEQSSKNYSLPEQFLARKFKASTNRKDSNEITLRNFQTPWKPH